MWSYFTGRYIDPFFFHYLIKKEEVDESAWMDGWMDGWLNREFLFSFYKNVAWVFFDIMKCERNKMRREVGRRGERMGWNGMEMVME